MLYILVLTSHTLFQQNLIMISPSYLNYGLKYLPFSIQRFTYLYC
uniref:Uncharacterized protein n=1 Tax=Arundo donax TaxID=35708 RepID=A0A0A9FZA6_ARUDO